MDQLQTISQVMAWLISDFNASFSEDDAQARDELLAHADALLQHPLTAIPLNGPLIAQVRDILTREPLAEYSYNRIIHSPRVKALQDWTLQRELRRVPRIADVSGFGGMVKRYEIQPDPDRLKPFAIPLAQLQSAVPASNVRIACSAPSGSLRRIATANGSTN